MNTRSLKKLQDKKYRNETGLFAVEGEKSVLELCDSSIVVEHIYCTAEFEKKFGRRIQGAKFKNPKFKNVTLVQAAELETFGSLTANNRAFAVAHQPEKKHSTESILSLFKHKKDALVVFLDNVNDPGNLGTILRVADWFGVDAVVASIGTADQYNPKTIAASMGSFTRVHVFYTNAIDFLKKAKDNRIPIVGTTLSGKDIRATELPAGAIIVMGSESHGASEELYRYFTKEVTLPRFGVAESLNVGVAAALVIDRFKA